MKSRLSFIKKRGTLRCPIIKILHHKYFSRMTDHFKNLFSQMIVVRQNQVIDMGIFGTDALMFLLLFLKFIDEENLYVFKHTDSVSSKNVRYLKKFFRSFLPFFFRTFRWNKAGNGEESMFPLNLKPALLIYFQTKILFLFI